jgi:hypothetical protein
LINSFCSVFSILDIGIAYPSSETIAVLSKISSNVCFSVNSKLKLSISKILCIFLDLDPIVDFFVLKYPTILSKLIWWVDSLSNKKFN